MSLSAKLTKARRATVTHTKRTLIYGLVAPAAFAAIGQWGSIGHSLTEYGAGTGVSIAQGVGAGVGTGVAALVVTAKNTVQDIHSGNVK